MFPLESLLPTVIEYPAGAIVGDFNWVPVEQATKIANESVLVSTFGAPDSDNSVDFHSAAYFLRYSNSLQVVRAVSSVAKNAYDTNASAAPPFSRSISMKFTPTATAFRSR